VQTPGALTFPITRANADDVLTVGDEEILATMRFMLFRMKLLVEPSGAAAAAAVFHRRVPENCRRVGVVLSGGNVDPEILSRVLHQVENK
jgi:threonine dehydratase